jgi:hypothetical protein
MRNPSEKPHDPTSSGGQREPLKRKDSQGPGADVKEPPPPRNGRN